MKFVENWQQNCTKSIQIGVNPYHRKGRWKRDLPKYCLQIGTWPRFISSSSSFPWGSYPSGGWSFSIILSEQREVSVSKKREAPWVLTNVRTVTERAIGKRPGKGSDRQGAEQGWASFNAGGSSNSLLKVSASKRSLIEPDWTDARSHRSCRWRGRS